MLFILVLQRQRITRRGSKGLPAVKLLATTQWPYRVMGKGADILCAAFLSLRKGRRGERWRVCRLRKERKLCFTFRFEFKADHVKKVLEIQTHKEKATATEKNPRNNQQTQQAKPKPNKPTKTPKTIQNKTTWGVIG